MTDELRADLLKTLAWIAESVQVPPGPGHRREIAAECNRLVLAIGVADVAPDLSTSKEADS